MVHVFNPSTWELEAGKSLGSKPNLVYRTSSKTARNQVSKKKKRSKKKKKVYPIANLFFKQAFLRRSHDIFHFPHYRWETKDTGAAMTEQKKQNLLLGYLLNRQLSINHYIQGSIHCGI